MPTLKFLIILIIGWCLLSGHFNILLLGLGLISCVVSVWIYNKVVKTAEVSDGQWLSLSQPLKHVTFCGWLLKEIVVANWDVLKAILNPQQVKSQFFSVDCGQLNEKGRVVYANSITLTPGTVTTEIETEKLSIHGLTDASREGLLDNKMRDKVQQLTNRSSGGD